MAHFGRPVEVVDVLVARAEQLWLGCEELTQVVLVRDDDLRQTCESVYYSDMPSKQPKARGVRSARTGGTQLTAIGLDAFESA